MQDFLLFGLAPRILDWPTSGSPKAMDVEEVMGAWLENLCPNERTTHASKNSQSVRGAWGGAKAVGKDYGGFRFQRAVSFRVHMVDG